MKILIPVLMLVSILLCSCAVFKAPVFNRVDQVELTDLTADHTSLDLSLVINNPNWYAIKIKTLNVEITDSNSVKLGDIVMTHPLKVEKHAADTVYFDILLDTRKVTKLLSHSAPNVVFIVKADALAKVFGISKRVKTELPQTMNFTKLLEQLLPTIPSDIVIPTVHTGKNRKVVITDPAKKTSNIKVDIFKIIKTSITDVGLKETELTVKFLMFNPYGFSFTFKDFPSEIWVNSKYAGKGRLAAPLVFDENVSQLEGKMVFALNNFNSILLTSAVLIKKDLDYHVKGTLMAEGFSTKISKPFTFRGTVEVGKKDK